MINIGELNRVIEIKYLDRSNQDDYGEVIEEEKLFSKRKAKYRNIQVKESEEMGGAIVLRNQIEFTIRYIKDLDSSMKILYDGDDYEIISITEWGKKHWIKITVKKNVRK